MSAPTPPDPAAPASSPAAGSPGRGAFAFPKARRVRDRRDYQRIQGRGIRLTANHFLVMALRQGGRPVPARLGITASKKSGEAVARARIKRLVREAFRLNPGLFPAGWDFVVIAREGADALTLTEVTAQLKSAVGKLNQGARPGGGGGPRRPDNRRPGRPPPGRPGGPPARGKGPA